MESKTNSTRMQALLDLYDMQTTYFSNAIDGISDTDANNRLNTKANHIAWLTGSLVQQRFYLAGEFGSDLKQSGEELFKNNQGIQDHVTYPKLTVYKKDWDTITPVLKSGLVSVTDEKLDEVLDMGGMKMSYYELISFMIYREANCIGQIALWRRLLDYPGMKYE